MIGVSAENGAPLVGTQHLVQSIVDILTTPIGTRVGRRDYGSPLFELTDQPMNGLGKLRLFAAVATALARWEPRLRLNRIRLTGAGVDGAFDLQLEGERTDDPSPNELALLTIPLRLPA